MLTFYKIDAKHAHHRSPPQYINTSQYIQQRPNTIYRIGCQLLRIANTNIYRDLSTATSSGQQCSAAHNPRSTATPDHVAHLKSWLFRNRPSLSVVSTCPTGKALRSRARCMQCVSALHADRVREGQATRSSCVFSMRACLFERVKGGFIGIHTCCIHYRPSIGMIQSI